MSEPKHTAPQQVLGEGHFPTVIDHIVAFLDIPTIAALAVVSPKLRHHIKNLYPIHVRLECRPLPPANDDAIVATHTIRIGDARWMHPLEGHRVQIIDVIGLSSFSNSSLITTTTLHFPIFYRRCVGNPALLRPLLPTTASRLVMRPLLCQSSVNTKVGPQQFRSLKTAVINLDLDAHDSLPNVMDGLWPRGVVGLDIHLICRKPRPEANHNGVATLFALVNALSCVASTGWRLKIVNSVEWGVTISDETDLIEIATLDGRLERNDIEFFDLLGYHQLLGPTTYALHII